MFSVSLSDLQRVVHPRGTSSLEGIFQGASQHEKDACYEELTCEDKIILSQLIQHARELPKKSSAKTALIILGSELKKLAKDNYQLERISIALKASLLKLSFHESPEDVRALARKLESSQELHSYLQNYLASIEAFYEVIKKIKKNPVDSYLLYALADKENWQAKTLSFFVDVPNFNQTPLGASLEWVHTARGDLIIQFEKTLIDLEIEELQRERFSTLLRRQLQDQIEQTELAVTAAERTVLGQANTYKKIYQGVLSSTIVLATWGTAGPLVFSVNGAGLFLAADSAIDLSESLIDAYSEGGSGDFYCSYARNNLANYELENVFINGAIGGGMAFVATGLLSTMLKSTKKWVKASGALLAGGAFIYGADAIVTSPAEQFNQLERERDMALMRDDHYLGQCLALAQKKVVSGIAINTTALLMSLKGLGEAHFNKVTNIEVPKNIDLTANSSVGPAPKISGLQKTSDLSTSKLVGDNSATAVPKRVRKNPPKDILGQEVIPKGKTSPRARLRQEFSEETEWSVIYLRQYLNDNPLTEVRLFDDLEFPDHPQGEFMAKMFKETSERFGDDKFVARHFREILAEYEYFREVKFNELGPPMDFFKTWRKFMRHVAKKEGLETVDLEDRFYGQDEFRQIVGKKILFDHAFTWKSHGETSHGLQILFIYRHFKDLKIPDELIDEYFRLLGSADKDIWGRLFDGFGMNFSSPETVNSLFKQMKFYDSGNIGL